MEEIWKDIEGYEGYYKINENGSEELVFELVWKGKHE